MMTRASGKDGGSSSSWPQASPGAGFGMMTNGSGRDGGFTSSWPQASPALRARYLALHPPRPLGRPVASAWDLAPHELKAMLAREDELRLSPETGKRNSAWGGASQAFQGF